MKQSCYLVQTGLELTFLPLPPAYAWQEQLGATIIPKKRPQSRLFYLLKILNLRWVWPST